MAGNEKDRVQSILEAYEEAILDTPDSELAAASELAASGDRVRRLLESAAGAGSPLKVEWPASSPRRRRPALRTFVPQPASYARSDRGQAPLRATFSSKPADEDDEGGSDSTE